MGLPTRVSLLLLCLVVAGGALAQSGKPPRGKTIYCCEDDSGATVCGDVLPRQCVGKAYRELNSQGVVRHKAKSREELVREREEKEARELEEERMSAQRRQDEALLETYPSLESIDEREARALSEVDRSLETVQTRARELLELRKVQEAEAEFYQGRDLPRELAGNLAIIDAELASHKTFIASKDTEKAQIRERFALDRERYRALIDSGVRRR